MLNFMETKTLAYLNSKVWYRFVKVIFALSILASLVITNNDLIKGGVATLDNKKSYITCTLSPEKSFTADELGIWFTPDQFKGGFDYKNFYSVDDNGYAIRRIYQACYDKNPSTHNGVFDIFAFQRAEEIRKGRNDLTATETNFLNNEVQNIVTGYKTNGEKLRLLDFSFKLFDIKPVITYTGFIRDFIISNLSILLFFEIARRIFYYIVLGTFKPQK